MKKIIATLVSLIILSLSLPVSAKGLELFYDNEYHLYKGSIFSLYVNDVEVESVMEPIIFNNRALVPLREVFEALGQKVEYDNITKEITVSGGEKSVKLQIGNPTAYIDGKKTTIPDGVVPKLITKVGVETKTMVPVRFVSENVGLLVNFDEKAGAIRINNPEPVKPEEPEEPTEKIIISAPAITKKSDRVTQIKIKLSLPMENKFKTAVTSSGVLYFDIENAEYEGKSQTEVNHGAVKMVRLGLHETYTRVAVDMEDYSKYDATISNDKKTITILITAKSEDSEEDPDEEILPGDEEEKDPEEDEDEPVEVPDNDTITVDVKGMMNYTPSEGVKYVIIDAGHGGHDSGAQGAIDDQKYYEKDINLSIAKMVRDKLEDEGARVIMTRDSDTFPTLPERPELANSMDAAMFVSIHVNSAANAPKANGIEVYYAKGNNENYYGTTSKALATSVLNSMLDSTEAFSRGVKVESHVVTKKSLMPAILVEVGFISNADEIKKLIDEDYQELLAEGIVEGILEHLDKIEVPDRRELAEMMVAKEVGEKKAKEYIDEVWE